MTFWSWMGLEDDPELTAANAAADRKVAEGKKAAIALSNYRQSNRNQYNKLLNARFAPYGGVNNRMAAAGLSGMQADLSPEANPVTLRDTGVGAPEGSNYLGYDEKDPRGGVSTHHTGLVEYLNGTALAPTDAARNAQLDQNYQNWLRNGGYDAQRRGAQYRSSRGDQHVVDVEGGMPTGTGEGIPTFKPGGDQPKGLYNPNEYYSRQPPQAQQPPGNAPLMSAGQRTPTSFFPQR